LFGNHVAFLAHHAEQYAFRGAALVRGNHVAKAKNVLHGIAKPREARRPGVGFVAAHHRRPLFGGHRCGSGVREQINQNGFGRDEKKIVAGSLHEFPAFFSRRRRMASMLLIRNGSMIVFDRHSSPKSFPGTHYHHT